MVGYIGRHRGSYIEIFSTLRKALLFIICIIAIMIPYGTEGAEKEPSGNLVVYTPWNEGDMKFITAAFNNVYPKIKVSSILGSRGALLERLITERNSGKYFADVYCTGIPDTTEMVRRGFLTPYKSPSELNLDPRFMLKDDLLHPNCVLVWMSAYNTKLLGKNELPKTWEELLLPKWKGQICIDQEPTDIVAGFLVKMGVEKAWNFLEKLAENVVFRRGRTLILEQLSTGEFPLTIDVYTHGVAKFQKDGAPIGAAPMPYYFAQPNVQVILKNAPNLENAKLWIDWSTSPSGQEAIALNGRGTVGKTKMAKDPQAHLIEGRELVVITPSNMPMDYNDIALKSRKVFITGK